jgi:hypothetical protein
MPLIEYVTVMPQGDDEKRAFRYRYFSQDIPTMPVKSSRIHNPSSTGSSWRRGT